MQGRLLQTIERYLTNLTRRGDVGNLGGGIREWRVHKGTNHFRVLFFDWDHIAVALTAFYKNKQRTPPEDLARAKSRRESWLATRGPKPPPPT